jgi:hypothetical protein
VWGGGERGQQGGRGVSLGAVACVIKMTGRLQ